MPDDDEIIKLILYQESVVRRKNMEYGPSVDIQLRYELDQLKSATEKHLDFDYKLRLSRELRKLRRRLKYGR